MKPVFLTAAVRTPIGRFGGSLKDWNAADLGLAVAKESLRRAVVGRVRAFARSETGWVSLRRAKVRGHDKQGTREVGRTSEAIR